jgi:hypothetical protein
MIHLSKTETLAMEMWEEDYKPLQWHIHAPEADQERYRRWAKELRKARKARKRAQRRVGHE